MASKSLKQQVNGLTNQLENSIKTAGVLDVGEFLKDQMQSAMTMAFGDDASEAKHMVTCMAWVSGGREG